MKTWCSIQFSRRKGSGGGASCTHMAEFISEVFIVWKTMLSYVFMEGKCQLVARLCRVRPSHMPLQMGPLCLMSSSPTHPSLFPPPPFLLMPDAASRLYSLFTLQARLLCCPYSFPFLRLSCCCCCHTESSVKCRMIPDPLKRFTGCSFE